MNTDDMEEDLSEEYYTSSEDGSVENSPRFPAQTGKGSFGVPKLNLFGLSSEEPTNSRNSIGIPKLNLGAIPKEDSVSIPNVDTTPLKLNLALVSKEDTVDRLSPKKKLTALNLSNISRGIYLKTFQI
jgi:hypothetical protein